jgi:hypothetical protein
MIALNTYNRKASLFPFSGFKEAFKIKLCTAS